MSKKIYVGNINYDTTEDTLRETFSEYGTVENVSIVTDRMSGRAKGFGFVEMETEEAAQSAISALNGKELDGRQLRVNEAFDKPRRDGGETPEY
jgi:RNA recognition motif-containing protein